MSDWGVVALEAVALGLVVNPYSAAAGAAAAAVVWTRMRSTRGAAFGVLALAIAWAAGEGPLRVSLAVSASSGGAIDPATRVAFWAAAAVSILVGYALPAWVGSFVGRRVTWGTGWLSAGVVALSAAGAVYAIGSSIAVRI